MPTTVNMHEAKALAAQAKDAAIAPPDQKNLPYNVLRGQIKMLDNYDDPIEEFEDPL